MSNSSSGKLATPARFFLGLAVALVLLLLLEMLLRFVPIDRYEEGGIGGSYPIFVPGERRHAGKYVTNPHFKASLHYQQFDRTKTHGRTRIFCLGSSAAMGWPGSEDSAFTGFLRRALDAEYPGRFEIVNAAGLSYGSHRVLDILYDVVDHEPDLVIIYSGNNEYVERNVLPLSVRNRSALKVNRVLRHSHLYRSVRLLLHHVSPWLFSRPAGLDLTDLRTAPVRRKVPGRTAEVDREVLENYRGNISEMARLLRASNIRGIFCTVPVNLAEWVPASLPPTFEDSRADRNWIKLIRVAFERYRRNEFRDAEATFRQALEIVPRHATARFFRGDALRRLGRIPEARDELLAACEHDDRPIRELPSFARTLLAVSAQQDVPVIDLTGEFAKQSGDNLVGLDLFVDYCHPNEAGHKLIAILVVRAMAQIPGGRGVDVDAVVKRIREDRQFGRQDYPANLLYALAITRENLGDTQGAERYYREILKIDPDYPEALSNLGNILYERGDRKEAEGLFLRSLAADPGLPSSLIMMGLIRLRQGKLPESRGYVVRVLEQESANPPALELMGDIAAAEKDWRSALSCYRRAQMAGRDTDRLREKIAAALDP